MYDLDYFAENLERPRKGTDYVLGLCPFHDDTNPSLVVYGRSNHYECFACGARGSLAKLANAISNNVSNFGGGGSRSGILSSVDRTPWRERPSWNNRDLAQYCLEAHARYQELTQTHWYLQDRGLHESVVPYGLGWDNGWYTVPVRDNTGRVKAAVARAGPHVENKTQMRFDMPLGQPGQLYVPDWDLVGRSTKLYVAFGVFDAISLAHVGLASASPTAGKKSVDPTWFDDIDKPIIIVPDRDESMDAHHLAMGLDWRGRVLHPEYKDGEKDPNDILVKRGRKGLVRAMEESK